MRSSPILRNILAIIVILLCFLIPHFTRLTIFIYPLVVLLVVWLYLKWIAKEKFSDLLFSFRRFRFKAVWIGLISAIILSAFFNFIWDPFVDFIIPSGEIDLTDFSGVKDNPVNYIIVLILALLVGGFYEEIIFHGLIFTRLEKLSQGKSATIFAFVLSNLIFGLYHYQQGLKGILLATIAGFAYHALILRFNRNLWYGIFFHAFFDFIGLTLIYLGKLP